MSDWKMYLYIVWDMFCDDKEKKRKKLRVTIINTVDAVSIIISWTTKKRTTKIKKQYYRRWLMCQKIYKYRASLSFYLSPLWKIVTLLNCKIYSIKLSKGTFLLTIATSHFLFVFNTCSFNTFVYCFIFYILMVKNI